MDLGLSSTLKLRRYLPDLLKPRLCILLYIERSEGLLFIASRTSSGFELWVR